MTQLISVDIDQSPITDLDDVHRTLAILREAGMPPDLVRAVAEGLCAVKAHNIIAQDGGCYQHKNAFTTERARNLFQQLKCGLEELGAI